MFTATVTIKNQSGLHARPATLLVNECKRWQSEVVLVRGDRTVDAKSIIGVLSGGFHQHEVIEVRVTGPDEDLAGPGVVRFIENLKD